LSAWVGFLKSPALRALSVLDGRRHRGAVHALQHNEPATIVDDRDDTAPLVAFGLGFGGRHHLPRRF
jgi:hypothetical protein